ncbi:MAG TPA: hypothetical protein VN419_07205 [Humidesulfovibrio sp.]|uniref:hypothetical protein n=1 Tax=Humidesulfovibrio sp. TaxID=2910988 RepID=UPI002BBCDDD6|nr:hypothetical protein [Humidesulfovibrio sp.]HWR03791.1 hypothetical protein [Humidesulfovibrio sp.]
MDNAIANAFNDEHTRHEQALSALMALEEACASPSKRIILEGLGNYLSSWKQMYIGRFEDMQRFQYDLNRYLEAMAKELGADISNLPECPGVEREFLNDLC